MVGVGFIQILSILLCRAAVSDGEEASRRNSLLERNTDRKQTYLKGAQVGYVPRRRPLGSAHFAEVPDPAEAFRVIRSIDVRRVVNRFSTFGQKHLLGVAIGVLLLVLLPATSGAAGESPGLEIPKIVAVASKDAPIGQPVHDQVDFRTGDEPTGSLTFSLYGPDDENCSGVPVSTSTVAVHGSGEKYESASYRPEGVGVYRYIAGYSGDAKNAAVITGCHEPGQEVVAQPTPPGTCHGQKATVTLEPQGITAGTEHHDVIVGNAKRNRIYGIGGNDLICGGGGNDSIDSGAGNDTVYGGSGNDSISGYLDKDRLFGEAGNDFIDGQSENDLLSGGAGNDRESGAGGNDKLLGGSGEDELLGGTGNDQIFGGPGNDEEIP